MRSKAEVHSEAAERTVRDIRRTTRRQHSAEEKGRIVIARLRGEDNIAELCRKEGINQNLYCRSSKEVLEASKKRLAGIPRAKRPATRSSYPGAGASAQGAAGRVSVTLRSKKCTRRWGVRAA